jgi:hypothetical protein
MAAGARVDADETAAATADLRWQKVRNAPNSVGWTRAWTQPTPGTAVSTQTNYN